MPQSALPGKARALLELLDRRGDVAQAKLKQTYRGEAIDLARSGISGTREIKRIRGVRATVIRDPLGRLDPRQADQPPGAEVRMTNPAGELDRLIGPRGPKCPTSLPGVELRAATEQIRQYAERFARASLCDLAVQLTVLASTP